MSAAQGESLNKMVCDMDDHGVHGDMKSDAMNVASAALKATKRRRTSPSTLKAISTTSMALLGTAL